MTTPNDIFAEKISNLLQQNWNSNAEGLQETDVFWSHDKFDTMARAVSDPYKTIFFENSLSAIDLCVLDCFFGLELELVSTLNYFNLI